MLTDHCFMSPSMFRMSTIVPYSCFCIREISDASYSTGNKKISAWQVFSSAGSFKDNEWFFVIDRKSYFQVLGAYFVINSLTEVI